MLLDSRLAASAASYLLFAGFIFSCSSVDSVAITSFFIFSSVYLRVLRWLKPLLLTALLTSKLSHYQLNYRSYFSVFFRGFRGHYDLAFIFSSVYFRVFPCASVAITILLSSFLPCISVCLRGHYDLAFIFSSVYFRVLPWPLTFIFSSVYFRVLPWQ